MCIMISNKYQYQINGGDLNNRHIDLDDASNIRDLGWYTTKDGKSTVSGLLFRSAGLHELSEASIDILLKKGIITNVDLRRSDQIDQRPDILGRSDKINYLRLPLYEDAIEELPTFLHEKLEGSLKTDLTEKEDRYYKIYIAWLEIHKPAIKEILLTLFNLENLPALYHCEAGTDRTGVISALILGVCGVEDELIAEDYGLSAKCLIESYFKEQAPPNKNKENYTWLDYQNEYCSPRVMLGIMDYIQTIYGGTENYIISLGINKSTIETFKGKFLSN